MLPTELLRFGFEAGLVRPRRFRPTPGNLRLASDLIQIFQLRVGQRRYLIDEDLKDYSESSTQKKVIAGLARLLTNHARFEPGGDIEPGVVRDAVFTRAQDQAHSRLNAARVLEQAAASLSGPGRTLDGADLMHWMYADLEDQRTLVEFPEITPQDLAARYDLAQAQGQLYRAKSLIITARRNEPARYKQLLKYLKFFQLMATVEGDAEYGFTLTVDGPASLFSATTQYGVRLASFLPALVQVTKWDLTAALKPRKVPWIEDVLDEWTFEMTSEDGYVSHYRAAREHDSALEQGFVERFAKLDTPWVLEREVDLVPVPGGVILPDFRLVNGERSVLVEIVGFWRPEYLRKKFELLRRSGRRDVIVCVSERLNVGKAGVRLDDFADRLVWFKGVLPPKDVLAVAERLTA